jgi:hypothetical protein
MPNDDILNRAKDLMLNGVMPKNLTWKDAAISFAREVVRLVDRLQKLEAGNQQLTNKLLCLQARLDYCAQEISARIGEENQRLRQRVEELLEQTKEQDK